MLTCCAGCVNTLDGAAPTSHLVDLLWEPEATMAGKVVNASTAFLKDGLEDLSGRIRPLEEE